MVDVCTLEDDVYQQITGGVFDLDRFELVRAGKDASEEEVIELVGDAAVILTDLVHVRPVTRRIIEAAESLKLIQCYTIGFDDVDLEGGKRGDPHRERVQSGM